LTEESKRQDVASTDIRLGTSLIAGDSCLRRNEGKGKRKEMKATLGWGLSSYTGKMQGVVFCHYKREGLIFVRKFTYPKITEHNHKIGSTTANLHSIKPSEGSGC